MPSLGLSNKATADVDQESSKFAGPVNDDDLVQTLDTVDERPTSLKYPNVERDLAVTTLWPEARKLFGHESELVCLTSYRAPQGKDEPSLVASSCKARNDVESAAIRLWDAKNGKCVGILKGGHRSTVSTMSFSVDGKYLVSSGKDRRICVWKKVNDQSGCAEEGAIYELSAAADSAHKRIIWSVHFCPKRPNILASGSRDGVIKLWCVNEVDDGSLDMNELCR
jgi:elongator complex protein 2